MKRKSVVHWCSADPYRYMVMTVVGDPEDGLRRLATSLRPADGFGEALGFFAKDVPFDDPMLGFCRVGRCYSKGGDSVIWFPRYPEISTLVHELLHAVQAVMESAGVEDGRGEADAYLMAMLTSFFGNAFAKDVKRDLGKPWTM